MLRVRNDLRELSKYVGKLLIGVDRLVISEDGKYILGVVGN